MSRKDLPSPISMAAVAMLLLFILMLSGCAHLTPKEQQAVNASVECSIGILTAAKTCVPDCMATTTEAERKQCAIDCVLSTAETSLPSCSELYGSIYSEGLGKAIKAVVADLFLVYKEAVDK